MRTDRPSRASAFATCMLFALVVGGAAVACGSSDENSATFGNLSEDGDGTKNGKKDTEPTGTFGGGQDGGTQGGDGGCTPNFTGIARDFKRGDRPGGHPDFEVFMGTGEKGIVADKLGTDSKPVYASSGKTAHTTGKANFDQWYRDTPGVNIPVRFEITPVQGANGVYSYVNEDFLPVDGKGFGNEDLAHNYSFTFELHTEFVYNGGETFTFKGDDDLWTFINGNLAIDLGGLHEQQQASVELDSVAQKFGLVKGNTYPLDVFHAERHSTGSHFRIDTSIRFTNCSPIVK